MSEKLLTKALYTQLHTGQSSLRSHFRSAESYSEYQELSFL